MSQLIERYFVVPHTHWDREWYRPFEHFRLLLGGVVDEVLDTLERDPEFSSFTLDGQAIVLEDYVAVRPENEWRLRALIAAGRIEIGPSYVLPDEFLVGGESLVRNLLIGRAVCERFGGRPSPAGYLPDSFGHPLQLPQILAGFGIETFLFSRGLGDELDDLGVAFNWVAPDGSSVLALQLLGDYSNFANIAGVEDAVMRVEGVLERFGPALARAGVDQVLLCNGTDHWRIQRQMPSVCAELGRRFPGSTFAIARYGDYVTALRTGKLPSWTGELLGSRLWNVLRGVNSARLYLKQANERAEQRLLSVETLAGLCSLRAGAPFPLEDVSFAWRELLKCHPHDSICGCSCDEVHRDMLARYASLDRTLDLLTENALAPVAGSDGGERVGEIDPPDVGVFNPLPFARSTVLRVAGAGPTPVALGGFEARTVRLAMPAPAEPTEGEEIVSDRFAVRVATDGTLTVDDLVGGRRFEGLHALEDELDMGDLYNFCPVEGTGVWRCVGASSRILSNGPLCWELEVSYRGERPAGLDPELRPRAQLAPLSVRTIVRLVRGSDRIEFETTIDNAAEDHRLRAVFPLPLSLAPLGLGLGLGLGEPVAAVRAEGQFAVVRRPLAPTPPRVRWCEPPDPTQHTLGAVALGPLALLTRGLPEYEARERAGGAELCLTMLRCVGVISRPTGAIATRPLGAGPGVATPEGQCLGRHVLEYALSLDADRLGDVALVRASQDYRCEPLVVRAGVELEAPLALEGEVVFSSLKGAEDGDGLILRVFNPSSEPAGARITGTALAVERVRLDETAERVRLDETAERVRLDETAERVRLDETGDGAIEDGIVEVGPGEIVSVRLRGG